MTISYKSTEQQLFELIDEIFDKTESELLKIGEYSLQKLTNKNEIDFSNEYEIEYGIFLKNGNKIKIYKNVEFHLLSNYQVAEYYTSEFDRRPDSECITCLLKSIKNYL